MENNFDKYFKDKFENRKFEMKPEYWEGAEALIEADERSGRWRGLIGFFGVALLVGIAGFFIWKNNNSTATSMVEENPNFINEKALLPNSTEQTKEVGVNDLTNNSTEDKKDVIENSVSKTSNSVSKTSIENASVTKDLQIEKNRKSKYSLGTTLPSPSGSFSQSIPKTVNSTAKTSGEVKDDFNQNQNQNQNQNSNQNTNVNSGSGNSNSGESKSTKNLIPLVGNTTESSNDKGTEEAQIENKILTTKDTKDEDKFEVKKQTLAFISPLDIFLFSKINKEFNTKVLGYPKPKKQIEIGVTAGVVGYPLIENSSTQPFIGFKGGFILEHNLRTSKLKLRDKWTAGIELLYHYRSGNFVATKEAAIVEYSFGRRSTIAQLTPKSLHYFEVPIYLKHHHKRWSFEGGALVSYLLGVKGDVNQNNETQTGWVTEEGFRKRHTNAILGVQYRLNYNLKFGIRANYSLNSILDKNAVLPNGEALRESGPLYLTFKVLQNFNFGKK